MIRRRRAAELRAANRQLAAEIRDAHAYVDWLTDEKNKAQRAAEQADARRRNAVTRAWQLAELAEQWRQGHEQWKDAYARMEQAEMAARDELYEERGRKPPRPYVIYDNPKDAA